MAILTKLSFGRCVTSIIKLGGGISVLLVSNGDRVNFWLLDVTTNLWMFVIQRGRASPAGGGIEGERPALVVRQADRLAAIQIDILDRAVIRAEEIRVLDGHDPPVLRICRA